MKLTEKSNEIYQYIKENGRVSVEELCNATARAPRSVSANINDLVKKGLAVRDKEEVEGSDKPVTYVSLTEDGMNFVPSDDED